MSPMSPETIYKRRWLILVSLVISLMVVILDNTILNVALPSISRELDASQAELTASILSYAVVFGSLQFGAGVLGDRYGRRRILVIGLVIFGVFSLLAAFAKDPNQLIVFRALMAIGASMVPPQTLSIITNVFPPAERGRAIGIWAGFTGAALGVGPIFGGFLLEHFWWGSIFFVNVPIVIVAVLLAVLMVPESKNPKPGRLDPGGIILSALGLGALVFGLVYGGQYNEWDVFLSTGLVITGVSLLAVFVWFEYSIDHPSFDVRFFKNPRFSASSGATALAFFALFGITFFLTFYYQFVRGFSPLAAGVCVLPIALAQVVFAPRAPKVVARIGPKFTVAMGLALLSVSLYGYLFVDRETPLAFIVVLLVLTGTGMAHIVAPATEAVMSTLPREVAGAGSAVNNTTRQVSGALGIAVFGSLLQVVYASRIADSLGSLPANLRDQAQASIGDTFVVVDQLTRSDPEAGAAAAAELNCGLGQACLSGDAFVSGMHLTSFVGGTIALLGVFVALKWIPRYSLKDGGGNAKMPSRGGPSASDGDTHAGPVEATGPIGAGTVEPGSTAPTADAAAVPTGGRKADEPS
jgi:EmrB/QacA subfamily drug resistance transporter